MKWSVVWTTVVALLGVSECTSVAKRAARTPGCGKKAKWVGRTYEIEDFFSGGLWRGYFVYVPDNYNKDVPTSLMFAFHGVRKRGSWFCRSTRLSKPESNPNTIVVFPNGVNYNFEGPQNIDQTIKDRQFVVELFNHIKNEYCIDENRVFGMGHSVGASLVNSMACSPELGGMFTAIALIAGQYYNDFDDDFCKGAKLPLPVFELHGTDDRLARYEGENNKPAGPLPSIPDFVARWGRRNQCDPEPKVTGPQKHHTSYKYTCHGVEGYLEHVKVEDANELYMSGSRFYHTDMTLRFMEFFGNHTRPLGDFKLPANYTETDRNATIPSSTTKRPGSRHTSQSSSHTLPGSNYTQPSISYTVPTNNYTAPTNIYPVPTNSYTVSTNSYTVPASSYSVPASNYSVPTSIYSVPPSSYSGPTSTYTVPTSSYSQLTVNACVPDVPDVPSSSSSSSSALKPPYEPYGLYASPSPSSA